MKKKVAIEYFDVVPFMKQKQRIKKRKEREKNKEPKESKKKDKEERDRERETEKEGGQKRPKEKERETLKINKKCPSLGETSFLYYKAKKGQETKNKTKKQKQQIRRV